MRKENRVGERKIMKCGEECEIVEYNGAINITVRFLKTGETIKSQYSNFKNGRIKSHFTPTVCGLGVTGLEEIKDKNGRQLKSYKTWHSMLTRCYDNREHNRFPRYKGCEVCKEWLFYPNFKKWYEENYYEIDNETMCLDKDILVKKNKVYSPETCVFVPERINTLFIKKNANRGGCPIGVYWRNDIEKYQTNCSIFDIKTNKSKGKKLGCYNTPQEAFNAYKEAKEENIKKMAKYYKDRIPSKLYDAMYSYKVHIDD